MNIRSHARNVLMACGVQIGEDFHRLRSEKVIRLVAWAKSDKYRAPKNANGSTARYYHAKLQRAAVREI